MSVVLLLKAPWKEKYSSLKQKKNKIMSGLETFSTPPTGYKSCIAGMFHRFHYPGFLPRLLRASIIGLQVCFQLFRHKSPPGCFHASAGSFQLSLFVNSKQALGSFSWGHPQNIVNPFQASRLLGGALMRLDKKLCEVEAPSTTAH